ncbi:MAG: VWA domain-containing protein [Bacteroidales bacterium]|nr:VWA domain-containing protein [Bacteroidales bacterium]
MLWLILFSVIIFPILFIINNKANAKKLRAFASEHLHRYLLLNYSKGRKNLKFIFLLLGICALLFAASDPKIGSKLEKVKFKNAEIIIAIDVSNSMLAEDVYPNRLEAAKMAMELLLDKLENYSVGLIVFAGDAFLQMPITYDFISAKMFLSNINTNLVPIQGTDIGAAINMALNCFSSTKHDIKRFIILISDGEDHEQRAIEAANEAQKKNIVIHTIGMGKPEGAPIPIINRFGKKEYKTDKNGNIIVTKTNDAILQQISSITGGTYIRGLNFKDIAKNIIEKIEKSTKEKQEAYVYTEFDHQYQYPLFIALIFLTLGIIFPEKESKIPFSKFIKKFKYTALILMLFTLNTNTYSQSYKKNIREGNKNYYNKKYDKALIEYSKAFKSNSDSFITNYNLGNALYKTQNLDSAQKLFNNAITKTQNKEYLAKAYHNIGNTYLQTKKIDESIESYKKSLLLNPNDTQTKYNLSYALMLKKMLQQQQNNKQQNQQQQNQQQNQQQQQQKQEQQKISKQDAENILKALQEKEKNLQDKMRNKLIERQKREIEKDW